MPLILSIETGTDICSVALARDGVLLELLEREGRDHASQIAPLTEQLFKAAGLCYGDLDGVAVSMGPGSYTGLRIGVSFAKGLCYGLQIPLLGISSLEALTHLAREMLAAEGDTHAAEGGGEAHLVPMIDARRMEVYMAIYGTSGKAQSEVSAVVIDAESLSELHHAGCTYIFGNGAEKCLEVLPWAHFLDIKPSAKGMVTLAQERLSRGEVEDVAYFEPFYLKEFQVIPSKKRLF